MKPIAFVLITAMTLLPACATVEIAQGSEPVAVASADSAECITLRRSAKTLSYVFAQNGWSHSAVHSKAQSAASVLLRGMKAKIGGSNAIDAYITKTSLTAMRADIKTARDHIETTAGQALIVLSAANLDENHNVRRDLAALETALLSARQAEMTFERALSSKSMSSTALDELTLSIDSLRAVTDAFGERRRGSKKPTASS
jgi:hypothetical protein